MTTEVIKQTVSALLVPQGQIPGDNTDVIKQTVSVLLIPTPPPPTEVIKQSIDVILKPDTYIGPEVRVVKQSIDLIIRPIAVDDFRRVNYSYIIRGKR